MAYPVRWASQVVEGTPSSVEIELPAHVTDDMLVFAVGQDNASSWTAPTGYTGIGTFASNAGSAMRFFYKRATSGAEANPTINGVADDWNLWVGVIRDVDWDNPVPQNNRTNHTNTAVITSGTITTTSDDCLLLYGACSDSTSLIVSEQNIHPLYAYNQANAHCMVVGCRNHRAAGVVPAFTLYSDQTDEGGNIWVIAIKNKPGGLIMPDANPASVMIDPMVASAIQTWTALSVDYTTINGSGVDTVVSASSNVQLGDPGPWSLYINTSSSAANSLWCGGTLNLGAAINIQNALVSFKWRISNLGSLANDGLIISFMDNVGAWKAYQVSKKSGIGAGTPYYTTHISTAGSTAYASSGNVDWTNITKVSFAHLRNGTTSVTRFDTSMITYTKDGTGAFTGGSSAYPVNLKSIADISQGLGRSYEGRVFFQGQGQSITKQQVQFGDGSTPTYVDLSTNSMETLGAFDATSQRFWNVAANDLVVRVKASADCTMYLRSCVLAPSLRSTFVIDATSSLSALYGFTGSQWSNWDWTDSAGVTVTSAIFNSCYSIQGVAGTSFQSCTFSNPALTTLLSMTAGMHAQTCAFIAAAAGNYAADLPTAGHYYLENSTFSGFTTELNVTATTGTVTIHLALGQTQPTYASAGAAVAWDQPIVQAHVGITGAVSGSRIMVRNETTNTEVYNDVATGYSLDYTTGTTYTAGDTYSVTVTYYNGTTAKLPKIYTGIASSAGFTIVISQEASTVYDGHGVDGATMTGIVFNASSIDIDLDGSEDPDVLWKEIYAKYIYIISTLAGIRAFVGTVFAVDAVNFQFSNQIVFNNLDPIPVRIGGDGYGKRLDAGSMFGTGNLQIDNGVGALAVETGVSGLTPTESAALIAASSNTDRLDALIENVSGDRFTAKALEAAPSSSGSGDWTATEKEHIRHRLGIDGTATAPTATPSLALSSDVGTLLTRITGAVPLASDWTPTRAGKLDNLDATVSSRLASASYTAPPSAATNASAVRTELTTELGRIDAAVSSRAVAGDAMALTAAAVDAVWDEPLTGATHNASTSAGRRLRQINTPVLTEDIARGAGVGTNQIQLATTASAVDGAYDPGLICVCAGAGAGQSRIILQYTGADRIATVNRDWKVPVDSTSEYIVMGYADLQSVNEGLVRSASSNTARLNANASTSDDVYVGQMLFLVSGTGADQAGLVTAYNGTTQTITIAGTWAVTPDSTTGYVMIPASPVLLGATTHTGAVIPTVTTVTDMPTASDTASAVRTELTTELGEVSTTRNHLDNYLAGLNDFAEGATINSADAHAGGKYVIRDLLYANNGLIDSANTYCSEMHPVIVTKLDSMLEYVSSEWRFTAVALAEAPSGGSGTSDWTATEREHIRHRLGIDGTATAPTATPSLALSSDVGTLLTRITGAVPLAADWTPTRAGYLDAAITSRLASASYTAPPSAAANATAVRSELTTELARIDVATSTRSTYAGADTAGTTTLLGRITGAVPLAADWTPTRAGYLDAAISTRSTYAGADTAGTTTLLGRITGAVPLASDWTPTRAGYLDAAISSRAATGAAMTLASGAIAAATFAANAITSTVIAAGAITATQAPNLDVAVSTRSTYAGADTSGTTTLLGRITGAVPLAADWTPTRAGYLDVAISSRLATAGYTVPPTAIAISTQVGIDLSAAHGAGAWGGSGLSQQQVRDAMALGTVAVPAAGSIDLKISAIPTNPLITTDSRLANLDATISSRLATAGYTAPANSDITAIKAKTDNLPAAPAAVGDVPTAAANAAAVRSNLTTELGRIDAAISTRSTLDAAGVWGYATRTITSGGITLGEIEASTVLAKEATVAAVPAGVWAYGVRALTVAAGLTPAQDATLTAINDKTSALPATPAAKSDIPTAAQNATAVLAVAYEGTESIGEYLRYTRAIMLGRNRGTKLIPAWESKDGSKVRVSAPISSAGIRGAITVLDPS